MSNDNIPDAFKQPRAPWDNTVPVVSRPKSVDRSTHRGTDNWIAKLTWIKVKEIRQRWRDKAVCPVTKSQLAKDYDVTFDTIHQVLLFATWKPQYDPDGPEGHYPPTTK